MYVSVVLPQSLYYPVSRNFDQLLHFAQEIFGKGTFKERQCLQKNFTTEFKFVMEIFTNSHPSKHFHRGSITQCTVTDVPVFSFYAFY